MSDIPNITSVVNSATELLDDIRGGAITRMKAQHEQALDNFGDEKAQKLNEFNNQKTSALNDLASRANNVIANVEAHLASSRDNQSHVRLTKNQELRENADGTFPDGWISSANITATLVETVRSGVPASERSALAQEFLSAIQSNTQHFYNHFNIWQIEAAPVAAGTAVYFPWQQISMSQAITTAAIVKHISGAVPFYNYCHGLEAGKPAKLCGKMRVFEHRNFYDNVHPRLHAGDETLGSIIQIALPASVTGEVELSNGAWGQFPFIGTDLKG